MLKEVLQLESWPEIYRSWMFCWKLSNGTWEVLTWTALRNQYLRMMKIEDTPFGQKKFEALRKMVKMEHEEQFAKGWITVKTLKEQKELGEPAKKRFKEAQIMSILEKFSKRSP
ncbi:hypothetical protein L5515_019237 [Caenorhabditis briggsae]|uniref:Uncharacterized protein n=1 Tax=Caenorhabditis briggsae TaxID=6238 RepID=A0AAE9FLI8_CAEBR|nr:hypothetical protein L5515_019237 [Caenorhabditis briggsae]